MSVLVVLGLSIPVIALSLLMSTTGNPMAGVFVFASSLTVLACRGGSIDGWLRRAAVPGAYRQLIYETFIWAAVLLAVLVLIRMVRPMLRKRFVKLAAWPHGGDDFRLVVPDLQAIGAGVICALVGAGLAFFLIRNADTGQVVLSLTLAFTVGSMAAHLALTQPNPILILLSPLVVAIGAYVYVLMSFEGYEQFLQAWFSMSGESPASGRVPGLALALPMHYASAGVLGAVLGLCWAQTILEGEAAHAAAKAGASSGDGEDTSTSVASS